MHQRAKIGVIGGGLGGLAASALLAQAGHHVQLFEKRSNIGGKLSRFEAGGFQWDLGPSLVTMPHVLAALWAKLGANLADDLSLTRLPVGCRYRWSDGFQIDETKEFWTTGAMAEFIDYARGIYAVSAETFLENRLGHWWKQLRWRNLPKLRYLSRIATRATLYQLARRFFRDPHLVQFICRFATYNGSSPYLTPAAFGIIPFVQAEFGSWYVAGGLYRIGERLATLAEGHGVRIERGTEVTAIETGASGYRLRSADRSLGDFDRIVCNQDVLSADATILPASARTYLADRPNDLATSGFVMLVEMPRKNEEMIHHNLFFSDDYRLEFDQIFRQRVPPTEPTIYVNIDAKTDPGRAPAGTENWFVLVNVPARRTGSRRHWSRVRERYGDLILNRLEKFGIQRAHAAHRHYLTPDDFASRYNAFGGSLYGFASHGIFSAFNRPPLRARHLPGVWFTGGSTHPGGGIPLVLLSGQMAAAGILEELRRRR